MTWTAGAYLWCALLLPADAPAFMVAASVAYPAPAAVKPTMAECYAVMPKGHERIVVAGVPPR